MTIISIIGVGYDSNIFLIKGKNSTIIDTGTGLHQKYVEEKIKENIEPTEIKNIILTHEHYDHCGGVKKIFELTNGKAQVYAHKNATDKIQSGTSDFARMLGGSMPKMNVDKQLSDNDKLMIGDDEYITIYTPGHTPGSICLYSKKNQTLFSGDTIFPYGYFGRYDFPGGSFEQLKQSIEKISRLDVERLYPGHESIIEKDANSHIKKSYENILSFG